MTDSKPSQLLKQSVALCGECGSKLANGAPGGLCPKCLFGAGLEILLPEAMGEPEPIAPRSSWPRRFGDYELLEEIARGGMGIVYRARQVSLNRIVAIKTLLFGEFSSEEFIQRFKGEAEAAAALQHPNIVAIHEIGEHDNTHYFSMEYVEGRSLADVVRERPMPVREAARLLQVLARAVHYAHSRGVLHRDLKPSNVLIDASGNVRLTDFGLAKRLERRADLSTSGRLVGTPNYMPPEQASPFRGPTGPASDVYALGAILYHLLTGRPPVVGESLEAALLAVLNDEPVALRLLNHCVPHDLETIALKCLQKNPQRRYATAEALAEDLSRYLDGKPIHARPISSLQKLWLWSRRRPAAASAIALLGVVAGGSAWTANRLGQINRLGRWDTYVSEMGRAQNEWRQGRLAEAFFHLQRQIPKDGETDLRGFEWRHLWNLSRGNCAFRLPVHADVVSWLGFSADGKSLATFGWDATNGAQIWNLENRSRQLAMGNATAMGGFSTDGELFVVGQADGSIAVHEARTGSSLRTIPQAGQIAAFAPEGKVVVTINADRALEIYDVRSGRKVSTFGHTLRRFFDAGRNAPLTISADGKWLALVRPGKASEAEDQGVELWNVASAGLDKFLPQARQFRTLQFSPLGNLLAAGDGGGEVVCWNWSADETRTLKAHQLPIQSLAFSPDGATLATGAHDESIRLWDVKTLNQKPFALTGQIGGVWSLAFSPDGRFLASGGRDVTVNLWDLNAIGPEVRITNVNAEKVGNFVFSPDSRLMASGCKDNRVRIWDVETQAELHRLPSVSYVVAFSKNGRELLVSDASGAAHWWSFKDNVRRPVPAYEALGEITSVEFSSDRRMAALGHRNGRIQLLEVDSGRIVGSYEGHRDAVLSLTFTSDGRRLASGGRDKEIRLWEVARTSGSVQVCAEHKGGVPGLAISGDGRRMVSGCSANTIKFWDLSHLERSVGSRSWHRAAIRTIAFSPDGERVASGSEDRAVKLWDFSSRRELASFEFDAPIRLVTFSPNANLLAVVTEKGALHLLRATRLPEADAEIRAISLKR